MKLCLHCAVLVSYSVLTLLSPRLFQAKTVTSYFLLCWNSSLKLVKLALVICISDILVPELSPARGTRSGAPWVRKFVIYTSKKLWV